MLEAAEFGVRADPLFDNGPAIIKAMNSKSEAGGGKVLLPPGILFTAEPIIVPDRIWLDGEGHKATVIKLANGVNAPVIQTPIGPPSAGGCTLSNVMIDGNAIGQVGKFDGVVWGGQAGVPFIDAWHVLEKIVVKNCAGYGFLGRGHQASVWDKLWSYHNGYGFNPSYDTAVSNCVSGRTVHAGFVIDNSGIYMSDCKAFYAGQPGYDYPGIVVVAGEQAQGWGFLVKNILSGTTLVGCHAQDNTAAGWRFENGEGVVGSALLADSNSHWGLNYAPGFDFSNYHDARLDSCMSRTRPVGTGSREYQMSAIRFINGADRNRVVLTHAGVPPVVVGPVEKSDSVILANQLIYAPQ